MWEMLVTGSGIKVRVRVRVSMGDGVPCNSATAHIELHARALFSLFSTSPARSCRGLAGRIIDKSVRRSTHHFLFRKRAQDETLLLAMLHIL